MSKGNESAGDRMRRLLAMMPWLRDRPGVAVADAAAHFGLTEAELLSDLHVVFMVGLPPYTPDALVDVTIDEDQGIWVNYAIFFLKPLRLTAAQGLALLASSDALLSVPGTDPDGALGRGLAKLAASLDLRPADALDMQLGMADEANLTRLRAAVEANEALAIEYFSYARDELGTRTIQPWRVFADSGAWYVEAFCQLADGVRLFRVDRIAAMEPAGSQTESEPAGAKRSGARGSSAAEDRIESSGTRVRLQLGADARWVTETYPCEVISEFADGTSVVDLPVSALPWLERLLLRLGPTAELLDAGNFGDPASIGADAARRILTRYHR